MTILLDPVQPVRFAPEWPATGAVYWLRVPRNLDEPAYLRALGDAGGRQWHDFDLLGELLDGLKQLPAQGPDAVERDRLAGIVDEYRARLLDAARRYNAGEWAHLGEAERNAAYQELATPPAEMSFIQALAREHFPTYRSMEADRAAFPAVRGIVAARMFLVGWDGLDVPFRRSPFHGVPDELIDVVPPQHLVAIGAEVDRLRKVGRERGKGSASPPGGPSAATTDSAPPTPPSDPTTDTSASSSDS